jgi:hypothetical protein
MKWDAGSGGGLLTRICAQQMFLYFTRYHGALSANDSLGCLCRAYNSGKPGLVATSEAAAAHTESSGTGAGPLSAYSACVQHPII